MKRPLGLRCSVLADLLKQEDISSETLTRICGYEITSYRAMSKDGRIRQQTAQSLLLMIGMLMDISKNTRKAIKHLRGLEIEEMEELDKRYAEEYDKRYFDDMCR